MAQYSFIKSAGGVLIPAIPDARAFINSKVKLGAVLYADFRRARKRRCSIAGLHRMKKVSLTKQVRGWAYNVRIPGICNFNSATSVVVHYRMSDICATAIEPDAMLRAITCSYWLDAINGRDRTDPNYPPSVCGTPRIFFALSKSGERRSF
ncbi:nuclease domain-containing protein [Phytobacter ursingii]